MQIHELDNFAGNINSEVAYLAIDNGEDTGKISAFGLLADVNASIETAKETLNGRIDNIIAPTGTAPNPDEVIDARYGYNGKTYTSLGDSIRGQIENLANDLGEPGVNLFGAAAINSQTVSGVTGTVEDSSITLNGTASAGAALRWYFGGSIRALAAENGDTLTLSYEEAEGSYTGGVYLSLNGTAESSFRIDLQSSKTFAKASNMTSLQFWVNSGTVFNNFKINIQIEKGEEATPFCEYGGYIANDKYARRDIKAIHDITEMIDSQIAELESAELVTNRFANFEVGTLSSENGTPSPATYRLRTINYIPFENFYKATWEGAHIVVAYCYASDYSYLGATGNFTSGNLKKSDITQYENIGFIKLLFSKSDVSTITLDELTTANFKLFTVLSRNNLTDYKNAFDLPEEWSVPRRVINKMQGTGFTFAIQTDTHFDISVEPIYYNALKNLSRRIGFDFIANLGDVVRGYEYDDVDDSYEEFGLAIEGLVDGAECSTFCLMGNHDNNSMYATQTANIENAFLPGELFSLFERPTTTEDNRVVWGSRKGLYFYRDFDSVRVIVMNTSDLPYEAVSENDINVNRLEISQAQVDWFTNIALDTELPVLVLSHAPLSGTNTVIRREAIMDALSEFTGNGGTVIACVAGHTHSLGATIVDGINHIICDNGGDKCEVFAVDLAAKTIKTQQIGKDFTGQRTFTY